ncbi:MAG: hypothetical protein H6718_32325 [Polyangiaceae bacterium]|nr:hypothetical protein [Myxococcales bacterium]MCB9590145.1 hypothetical protein [Polyangiaceae bacterium]MCB9608024.1 hypothetical protein [Polyangiaceae bacterium]
MRIPGRLLVGVAGLGLALQWGCGGGTPAANHPGDGESGAVGSDGPSSAGGRAVGDDPSDPCADGSCVTCGEGVCPEGYFCNESAAGGAGCGWLAECAEAATCACVQPALGSGCECNERGGFAVVSCSN